MSFGASVLRAAVVGDDTVFVSGRGTAAVKGEAFTPVAATAPPTRTANLPAMPLRNCFRSFCIQVPSICKILIAGILYQELTSNAIFFGSKYRLRSFGS